MVHTLHYTELVGEVLWYILNLISRGEISGPSMVNVVFDCQLVRRMMHLAFVWLSPTCDGCQPSPWLMKLSTLRGALDTWL